MLDINLKNLTVLMLRPVFYDQMVIQLCVYVSIKFTSNINISGNLTALSMSSEKGPDITTSISKHKA